MLSTSRRDPFALDTRLFRNASLGILESRDYADVLKRVVNLCGFNPKNSRGKLINEIKAQTVSPITGTVQDRRARARLRRALPF